MVQQQLHKQWQKTRQYQFNFQPGKIYGKHDLELPGTAIYYWEHLAIRPNKKQVLLIYTIKMIVKTSKSNSNTWQSAFTVLVFDGDFI